MKMEERLKVFNDIVRRNEVLTTEVLEKNGLNSNDISCLVRTGLIKREKVGVYSLNIDYNKVYETIYLALKNNNFEECFKNMEILINSKMEKYNHDGKYFKYLLSHLIEWPRCEMNISLEEIMVLEDDFRYSSRDNTIRKWAVAKKYELAKLAFEGNNRYESLIEGDLIGRLVKKVKANNRKISTMIKDKNYEALEEYLEEWQKFMPLAVSEECILIIIKDYLRDKKNGKVLKFSNYPALDILEAVKVRNYRLALDYYNLNFFSYASCLKELLDNMLKLENVKAEESVRTREIKAVILDEEKLKRKKVMVFEVKKEEREDIINYVKGKSYVRVSEYTLDDKNYVVLFYSNYMKGKKEEKSDLVNMGLRSFKNGAYDKCIKYLEEFLLISDCNSDDVYYALGVSYANCGNYDLGYIYLNLAIFYAKKGCNKKKAMAALSKINIKNKVSFEDEYYGISNIEEISLRILNGENVFEVCKSFGLTEEMSLLVLLIMARECFKSGFNNLGEKYLKCVEKWKNKTDLVKREFNKVLKNKKLYKAKEEEGYISLLLKPKVMN